MSYSRAAPRKHGTMPQRLDLAHVPQGRVYGSLDASNRRNIASLQRQSSAGGVLTPTLPAPPTFIERSREVSALKFCFSLGSKES